MNDIQIFTHSEFGELGILPDDGRELFPAAPAATLLGYSNPHDAIARHCRCIVKREVPHPQARGKTTALNFISRMMEYPESNLLIVRKTFRTLHDSCFAELNWAIKRLHVEAHWRVKELPLEMTYIPTGQKIYFRGLDDPLKITSITVDTGCLCWMWIEEAYEIGKEADFDVLDESIRGQVPAGLFKQITLTFNPWNEKHWIKHRFFDADPDPDILAITTNYMCNEFLDAADLKVYETMRVNNPRRFKVAGLGDWGIVDGLVYENWDEQEFNHQSAEFKRAHPAIKSVFGLDFGYTNDPSALFCGLIDTQTREIFVFDEIYEQGMLNSTIAQRITQRGYGKARLRADCSEPKSIDELYGLGLRGIRKARKGKDSIAHGVQFIQGLKIIVHPRCVNFLTEISNYTWDKDRFGNKLNKPIDDFNHAMDAMRYALEEFSLGGTFSFD